MNFKLSGFHNHTGFALVPADSEELKDCVYRLRYHIYVEIMHRSQIYADHNRKTIREPLDEAGTSYLGIKDGKAIGTIRRNLLNDPATAYYAQFYRADLFEPYQADRLAISTKLMILPEHQRSIRAWQLVTMYCEESYRLGTGVDIIDCNAHLVEFFERLGYFNHIGWAAHKEYGDVLPMFFPTDTTRYLQRLNSPFAAYAIKYRIDGQYGGYELIRRLAKEPTQEFVRQASSPYRTACSSVSVVNA